MINYLIRPGGCLTGTISVPGDKSISHRSVILGAICDGVTEVSGILEGMDVLATIHAFREMGIFIDGPDRGHLAIHGSGLRGLKAPNGPLDLGNSGTSMRLLTGLLSAQRFDSELMGDKSLNKRPMMRVVRPLTQMGAQLEATPHGTPPVKISANHVLKGRQLVIDMPSAQVKSAILLAGLYADSKLTVTEPVSTRDHTERMLADMGCEISNKENSITLTPPRSLRAKAINVPADISSAAFFMIGASIAPGSKLTLPNIGVNPTRTGVIEILKLMGASIELKNRHQATGEPVADIEIHSAQLKGIEVPQHLVALAIDEFPGLMIAAACARGKTVITGAKELRVKESDRIAAMVSGLKALGIEASELEDGAVIQGGTIKGGEVDSFDDHRVSMSFAIAGLVSEGEIKVKDCRNVVTSFPGFVDIARPAGLDIKIQQ